MTDINQIAKGLSDAMAQALERLCERYCWADGRSVSALERRGLAVSQMLVAFGDTPDRLSAPTPLGLQVRAQLLVFKGLTNE
jgi:hypothetical protein